MNHQVRRSEKFSKPKDTLFKTGFHGAGPVGLERFGAIAPPGIDAVGEEAAIRLIPVKLASLG